MCSRGKPGNQRRNTSPGTGCGRARRAEPRGGLQRRPESRGPRSGQRGAQLHAVRSGSRRPHRQPRWSRARSSANTIATGAAGVTGSPHTGRDAKSGRSRGGPRVSRTPHDQRPRDVGGSCPARLRPERAAAATPAGDRWRSRTAPRTASSMVCPGSATSWGPSSRSACRAQRPGPRQGYRVPHARATPGEGALSTPGTTVLTRADVAHWPASAASQRRVPTPSPPTSHLARLA